MTPSIPGGTGHLQQTAGLRSEQECWGNFLSRQAGLRMILSTVDTPSATPPPGGSTGWWGEISLSLFFFFFFSPFFYLFIYLYRVSPRWGEALGRNKMSFFQEKIFLTKKNIFRPGANALPIRTFPIAPNHGTQKFLAKPRCATFLKNVDINWHCRW